MTTLPPFLGCGLCNGADCIGQFLRHVVAQVFNDIACKEEAQRAKQLEQMRENLAGSNYGMNSQLQGTSKPADEVEEAW